MTNYETHTNTTDMNKDIDQNTINSWQGLLKEFSKGEWITTERMRTFMQIAGCGHKELAASNILSFLFDTKQPHGLGNILTRALYDLYEEKKTKKEALVHPIDESTEIMAVHTEYPTANNKRIDILIETDSHVICIENKIFASLYNDLKEYEDTAEDLADKGSKEYLCFVLSPWKEPPGDIKGFIYITYSELFDKATNYMHKLDIYNKEKHFLYLQLFYDLFQSIEDLTHDENMKDQFQKFLYANNCEQIPSLVGNLRDYMRSVIDQVNSKLSDKNQLENITQQIYDEKHQGLDEYALVHDVVVAEEGHFKIDTLLNLKEGKWQIRIGDREKNFLENHLIDKELYNKQKYKRILKKDYLGIDNIKKSLTNKGIFTDEKKYSDKQYSYIYIDVTGNDIDTIVNIISNKLNDIIEKLLG